MFSVTVEFGEPLSANLRCQRFQAFVDNAPSAASASWTVDVPSDLERGTFRAIFRTESEDEFKQVKAAIKRMASKVIPYTNIVYAGSAAPADDISSTDNVVSAGSTNVKMKCESACGRIVVFYSCGKSTFNFPENMLMGEKMAVIRSQHLKWLRGQTNLDWPDFYEINDCYEKDTSIDKLTRHTLESVLKEKLVYYAIKKYKLSLRYKQVRSLIRLSLPEMMSSVYSAHRQWLEQQPDIPPATFTQLESLYINDRFLDEHTHQSMHNLLWYKHYVIWQGKENKRLRKKYPFWTDFSGNVDVYSAESDSDDSDDSN